MLDLSWKVNFKEKFEENISSHFGYVMLKYKRCPLYVLKEKKHPTPFLTQNSKTSEFWNASSTSFKVFPWSHLDKDSYKWDENSFLSILSLQLRFLFFLAEPNKSPCPLGHPMHILTSSPTASRLLLKLFQWDIYTHLKLQNNRTKKKSLCLDIRN